MNEQMKSVYVLEIKSQCQFAICALRGIENVINEMSKMENIQNPATMTFLRSETLRNIHSLLTHASNISKIFWPPLPQKKATESQEEFEERLKQKYTEKYDRLQRAKIMQELYAISESNHLKDRTLRDHLEHYDERLDHWRQSSKGKNIVGDNIGPKDLMRKIFGRIEETDMMRNFDPQTRMFHFRGEVFNLQNIADAIKEMYSQTIKIEEKLDQQRRNRPRESPLPQPPSSPDSAQ